MQNHHKHHSITKQRYILSKQRTRQALHKMWRMPTRLMRVFRDMETHL
jgi:HD-like signal output (HDOD) protein